MSDGGRHSPHLSIAAFSNRQFDPARGALELGSKVSARKVGLGRGIDELGDRGGGGAIAQAKSLIQPVEVVAVGGSFNHDQVGLGQVKPGVTNPRLQRAIVTEDQ